MLDLKNYGSKKNQLWGGGKYSLYIRIHWPLTKYNILRIWGIFGGFFFKKSLLDLKILVKIPKIKNPQLKNDFFCFSDNFILFQKNAKKVQNQGFWGFFFKNPRILKNLENWKIPNWQKMLKLFFRHFFCYFKKINKNLKICIFGVFLGIFQKSPKSKNPSWLATLLSGNPKYSLCISIHWPLPTYEISSWYLKRFKRYRGGRTDRRTDRHYDS